jgi:hypothetical protein
LSAPRCAPPPRCSRCARARGLLGNHVNISDGSWPYRDSGIGHGVDSFYEYLAKAAQLFESARYERLYRLAVPPVERLLYRDGFYLEADMASLATTWSVFNSLQAFWPGVLAERGELGARCAHHARRRPFVAAHASRQARAKHILRRMFQAWLAHDGAPEKAQVCVCVVCVCVSRV